MTKKLLAIIAPVAVVALIGAGTVSAHSGLGMGFMGFGPFNSSSNSDQFAQMHQQMFERMASMLGISVDVVKNGWAQGQSITEIAKANGISETDLQAKMQSAAKQQLADQLKVLVDKGVITQAQADQRLNLMQNDLSARRGAGKGMMMGFGHGMKLGWLK